MYDGTTSFIFDCEIVLVDYLICVTCCCILSYWRVTRSVSLCVRPFLIDTVSTLQFHAFFNTPVSLTIQAYVYLRNAKTVSSRSFTPLRYPSFLVAPLTATPSILLRSCTDSGGVRSHRQGMLGYFLWTRPNVLRCVLCKPFRTDWKDRW